MPMEKKDPAVVCAQNEIHRMGVTMKYAIISDVHGNYPALKLAIEDAIVQGADEFLFVGDYCITAPWPCEVVEMLQGMKNARIISGNGEKYLKRPIGDDGQFGITYWTKKKLSKEQTKWLLALPDEEEFMYEGVKIYMVHDSDELLKGAECRYFSTEKTALRYLGGTTRQQLLMDVQNDLGNDKGFQELLDSLPGGVYIFAHTHVQWYLQTKKHLFINSGSCGQPLDCMEDGAAYTLLTIQDGKAFVEERRVPYDVEELIRQVKKTSQYEEARVWTETIIKGWRTCREQSSRYIEHVEKYAQKIGDERRPFTKETWDGAFDSWDIPEQIGRIGEEK